MTKIRQRVPVEEYLRPQRRFAHCSAANGHADACWPHPGRSPTATSARYGLLDEEDAHDMQKPFAITLDPGS